MQWFVDRYLSAPESDALYCDIIRYICRVHHPANAILASNIVQRWAVIQHLLQGIKVWCIGYTMLLFLQMPYLPCLAN
jgi:integrator complex subunit 3